MALVPSTSVGGGSTSAATILFDYIVSGSSKASIDTNVDGTYAGAFSASYTTLEVFCQLRTDDVTISPTLDITFNNDVVSGVDRQFVAGQNTTNSAGKAGAAATLQTGISGNGAAANYFSPLTIVIPNYSSTVANKQGVIKTFTGDTTSTNLTFTQQGFAYRGTAAITRLLFAPNTGGKLFLVGSRVTVYAR